MGYRYQNQLKSNGTNPGMIGKPSTIERLLDDGTLKKETFTYNQLGKVMNYIDERGRNFTYVYAPNQIDLIEIRQTKGQGNELLLKATYNAQHRPLTITGTDGQTYNYSYNTRGQVTSITNPKNEVTGYEYDNLGYLKKIKQQNIVTAEITTIILDVHARQKILKTTL
ncbi:MAG: RHS repeat domain-containing protein [Verrucomicrobiia bacterium]